MWINLLKYEAQHNKVYTSSVRRLMPIIQHPLYNAISQKPLQEAGGKHKILQLFASIWQQSEDFFQQLRWKLLDYLMVNIWWEKKHPKNRSEVYYRLLTIGFVTMSTSSPKSGSPSYLIFVIFFTQPQFEALKFYTWKYVNSRQKLPREKTA